MHNIADFLGETIKNYGSDTT